MYVLTEWTTVWTNWVSLFYVKHKHPNIASTPEHCINAQTLHQHRNIHQYHSKLESTPKLLGPFSMFCCRGIVKKHLWCSIIRSKSAFYERYMYQQYRLIIYFAKLNPNFSFSWAEMVFNLDLSHPPSRGKYQNGWIKLNIVKQS